MEDATVKRIVAHDFELVAAVDEVVCLRCPELGEVTVESCGQDVVPVPQIQTLEIKAEGPGLSRLERQLVWRADV
jgi:hypothetical protein